MAPILTGWKCWIEFNAMSNDKIPRNGWFVNLRMSGSIPTNKVEKAVSWNVGPHMGKKAARRKYVRYLNKDPP